MSLRDVAIVGVHATRQARVIDDLTPMQLTLGAINAALDDAGLTRDDVDGAAVGWPGPGGLIGDSTSWARFFGHPLHLVSEGGLDNSGARAVLRAASAIETGLCDVVVVGGGSASGPFVPGGGSPNFTPPAQAARGPIGAGGQLDPWGGYVASNFALVAQRHMHEYGTTREQMAEVAATIRNNGHENPEAVMYDRGPYTIDDVLQSRPVASPFNLLDVCLVAQGGAALVLTSLERARDLKQTPVVVLGGAMEFVRGAWTGGSALRECRDLGKAGAKRTFGMAGLKPDDVDVMCVYDPTSFEVLRAFEWMGLCGEGEGGPFIEGGTIARDGRFPVNPEGGCLSHAWNGVQQMTLKVVEAVKQLRGQAGTRQIPDCDVAFTSMAGSGAMHVEMALLGRA
ncbi:MAG: thiolase family protein [Acidobacteria bacterium]|nr:thiolase family protein [Acidobacteriota bacterium]